MTIDCHEYSSVEHYYQATKLYMLGGPTLSNQLKKVCGLHTAGFTNLVQVNDPGQVKSLTKRLLRGFATEDDVF